MWEGLGRGQGCLQPFPAFRGSRNVLAHFGVLKGHVEKKKILREIWECGPQGKYNRRPRVRCPALGKSLKTCEVGAVSGMPSHDQCRRDRRPGGGIPQK